MSLLSDFRSRYPIYNDIPDEDLAERLYSRFYSNVPREEFLSKVLPPKVEQQQEYAAPQMPEEQMAAADVSMGLAEARQPSVTEGLPAGAPVSARPLAMPTAPARVETGEERRLRLLGLGAAAEEAIASPAPAPTRPGPTIEAARQLEQERVVEEAKENIGDILAAQAESQDLFSKYKNYREVFAKEYPLTGATMAGAAGMISGMANVPSVTADAFNQTFINPVLNAAGLPQIPRVSTAFGTEFLAKAASDYMPEVGKQGMEEAYNKGEFGAWLASKVAANSPQIAQQLAAAFVPALRPLMLGTLSATAAGQSFAEGDDPRVAAAKGAVEYVTEKIPLGVFDKVNDVLRGMSPAKQNVILAVAGQRLLQAGGAITVNGLTNAVEETAAQLGGNVLDKYFQGKDIELTKDLGEAAVVGAVTGKVMSAPQVAAIATGRYEPQSIPARTLEGAGFAPVRIDQATRAFQPEARVIEAVAPQAPIPPARTMEQVRDEIQSAQDLDTAIATSEQAVSEVPTRAQITAAPAAVPAVEQPRAELTEEQILSQIQGVVAGEPVAPAAAPKTAAIAEAAPAAPRIQVPPTGRVEAAPIEVAAPSVVKAVTEPPVQKGFTRVYHSGSVGEGKSGRFVSTDRRYAEDYRQDLPLFYLDIPSNDPRVNNPDYPNQGAAEGFTFNFELTPDEASALRKIERLQPAAPAAPAFTDLAAKKADKARGIVKGEVLTFAAEKQAAAYAKSNKIRGYAPRQTEEGWVLSKPVRERTPAQIAATQQRMQVRPDDDLLTALAKMGGLNAENIRREGADKEDLKTVNKSYVLKPFRKTGGMTVDGAAEVMAEMGYDVFDEDGRIDANKAWEIISETVKGDKVYSPEGYEILASRSAEERAQMEAEKEAEAIAITEAMPAMAEDELLAAAALPREETMETEILRAREPAVEMPPGAEPMFEAAPGEFVVATPIVQQENIDQAFAQAETQLRQGNVNREVSENNDTIYEPREAESPSNAIARASGVQAPTAEYSVRGPGRGVRLLAGGFNRALAEEGKLSLLGQVIKSPADLAELAQIYRNPGYETFRAFFVDADGKIIYQTGVSSRLPGQTGVIPGPRVTNDQIIFEWFENTVEQVGADGFYILHNHPSGDPSPSKQDVEITAALGERTNRLISHVVIDTNRFAEISGNGEVDILPLRKQQRDDPVRKRVIENGIIGTVAGNAGGVAQIGRTMVTSKDMAVVIASGRAINAIGEIPNGVLLHPQRGPAAIRRFARFNGGSDIFIYANEAVFSDPAAKRLWDDGFVTDIVAEGGRSYVASAGRFSPNRGTFGVTRVRPVQILGEKRAVQEPSAEALPVREGARGGEAVGKRDAQREEAAREGRVGEAGAEEVAFREADYRPSVVNWAKKEFGGRIAPNGNPVWENFVRWARNATMVTAGNALSYNFQTGKPFVAESFHGTNAEEDFEVFDAAKGGEQTFADSARQGFFSTTETEVAGSYSANIGAGRVFTMMLNGAPDYVKNDPEAIKLDEERKKANEAVKEAYDAWYGGVTENINKRFAKTAKEGEAPEVFTYEQGKRIAVGIGFENKNDPLFPPGAIDRIENAVLARDEAEFALSKYISDRVTETIPMRIMPLYVRMENPMVFDAEGKTPADFPLSDRIAEAKSKGHDGVVFKNIADPSPVAVHYVTFNNNDLKSAVGNNGNFSTEPSIVAEPTAEYETGQVPVGRPVTPALDDAIRKFQDRNIDIKRVIDAFKEKAGTLLPAFNPYLQEGLSRDRKAAQEKAFEQFELLPMLLEMAKRKVSLAELEEYLHARHAPDYNEEMAKRNPNKEQLDQKMRELNEAINKAPQGSVELQRLQREKDAWSQVKPFSGTEEERNSLSGMSTKDAEAHINNLPAEKKANIEAVAEMVDKMVQKTGDLVINSGADPASIRNPNFRFYVPLKREGFEEGGGGYGQGFSVTGKFVRTATGSRRKVVDIISNISEQRIRAINRAENNRVANALLGFVMSAPNPELWSVDKVGKVPRLDRATGAVVMRPDPEELSADNIIVARVPDGNGGIIERKIVFNPDNETSIRIASAFRKNDTDLIGDRLAKFAILTRWFANMSTQYNPIFGGVNFIRDLQSSAVRLTATPLAGKQAELIGTAIKVIPSLYKDLRARRKGERRDSQYAEIFKEFESEGGRTLLRTNWEGSAEKTKELQKIIQRAGEQSAAGRAVQLPGRVKDIVADWLTDYNDTLESAIRLAAYKMSRDQGISKPEAAMIAKDITVNFSRKGTATDNIGALYAFFNASVQGTANMANTLDVKINKNGVPVMGRRGQKIVAGGVLLGVLQGLFYALGDYEEGEPPDFVKEKNLVIPFDAVGKIGEAVGITQEERSNRYFSIPIALGYNFFPNIGRIATELALGGFKDPGKKAGEAIKSAFDSFSPIGAAMSWQLVTPTAVDPIMALIENKDWTGKPIYRESFDRFASEPGFKLARDNASFAGIYISRALNYMSGGTEYSSGVFPTLLSPTPDQIDYLIGQAFGGIGRELTKIQKTAAAQVTGEELPAYSVPVVSRFFGEVRNQASHSQTFYDNVKLLIKHQQEIKGREEAGEDPNEYISQNPEAEISDQARKVMREVQQLRKAKREKIAEGIPKEEVREYDEEITQIMAQFNDEVKLLRSLK